MNPNQLPNEHLTETEAIMAGDSDQAQEFGQVQVELVTTREEQDKKKRSCLTMAGTSPQENAPQMPQQDQAPQMPQQDQAPQMPQQEQNPAEEGGNPEEGAAEGGDAN